MYFFLLYKNASSQSSNNNKRLFIPQTKNIAHNAMKSTWSNHNNIQEKIISYSFILVFCDIYCAESLNYDNISNIFNFIRKMELKFQQSLVIIEYSIRYQLLWKFYTIKIKKEQQSNETELSGWEHTSEFAIIHTNRYESSENNKKMLFCEWKENRKKEKKQSWAISMIQHDIDDE